MDPAPVLTEADVCRKITAATQLLTERRKLHDLATQAITKQQILMDAGLVTAKTIKASTATIKKAAEAVSDAENQTTFKQLQLADINCHQPDQINILLGADMFREIMLSGHLNNRGYSLGSVILGKAKSAFHTFISNHGSCYAVEFELDKLWQLEEISNTKPYTQEEVTCEKHFIQIFSRDSTGRFDINLAHLMDLALLEIYT
ncbi:hypothetical protein CDAR_513111 [Caerostris darwini]|uniref:Uncharacterized protein n=1 Tax=Caerostris darwini TaxID=1538125 RepID=A0AAV4W2S9_9ARAC|nr:hypothetical protein CDAR_513111 [Caerostris darwini]